MVQIILLLDCLCKTFLHTAVKCLNFGKFYLNFHIYVTNAFHYDMITPGMNTEARKPKPADRLFSSPQRRPDART